MAAAAPAEAAPSHVKIVSQRVNSGRLLVDAATNTFQEFNRGLVFSLAFTKHCPLEKNLKPICKSLLSAGLASSGQWQADHGDTESVLGLAKLGVAQDLVIVPQASLVAKLIPGDKYLKYHQQSTKADAEVLYKRFLVGLATVIVEGLEKAASDNKDADVSGWRARQAKNAELLSIPPERYFLDSGDHDNGTMGSSFGSFDENGFPLTEQDGSELAKSKRKKLEKMWSKYKEKWEKQAEARAEQAAAAAGPAEGTGNGAAEDTGEEQKSSCASSQDISDSEMSWEEAQEKLATLTLGDEKWVLPRIIPGTFGGRQGLEFVSSGPFGHSLSF